MCALTPTVEHDGTASAHLHRTFLSGHFNSSAVLLGVDIIRSLQTLLQREVSSRESGVFRSSFILSRGGSQRVLFLNPGSKSGFMILFLVSRLQISGLIYSVCMYQRDIYHGAFMSQKCVRAKR